MNALLWTAQILLALFFGAAGYSHALMPFADAAKAAPWLADMPRGLSRFIGVAELAGALGVVLPTMTRIRPSLASIAAGGLTIMMMLAIAFHLSRGESRIIGMHLVAGAMAGLVAWGRAKRP
jgi:hypothetical protein